MVGRFGALWEGGCDFASGLRKSWHDMAEHEEPDDSTAANRPISADEMESCVEFLAEYGV